MHQTQLKTSKASRAQPDMQLTKDTTPRLCWNEEREPCSMQQAIGKVVPGRNFGDGQITINQNVNYKTKTT